MNSGLQTDPRRSETRDPWQTEYPYDSHWLTLGDVRYHYVDEGEGPCMLMVHGNPTWSFHFRKLIDHFRHSHRVIAVDHVGCGMSDKPRRYPYTLHQHATNLQQLLRELDLRHITLVAHDWGGPIGLETLVREPDRFDAMVLCNTGAFPPPYIPWRIRACRIPVLGTCAVRGANAFVRAARWMAVYDRHRLTQAARQGLAAPYSNWSHRVAIDRFVKDIPAGPRHPNWQLLANLEERLRQVANLPTLLLWGMRDWCFREECLTRLQAMFPHAQVAQFADVGHWVIEEIPNEVVARIDAFLAPARS